MSSITARLQLELPEGSESMALGDNILSDNYNKIDAAMGVEILAGSSANPFPGHLWNNTVDTYLNIGSFFTRIGGPDTQRGFRAYEQDAVTRETTTEIEVMSVNFNSKASRAYLVEYSVFVKFEEPNEGLIRLELRRDDGLGLRWTTFNWNGGEDDNHLMGTDKVGSFQYVETVDRNTTITMYLDASDSGGAPITINQLGVSSSLMVNDWGR